MKWPQIHAVATKEWRLNMRFPMEYFFTVLANPVKTSIFMIFIYQGFLGNNVTAEIGRLNAQNYKIYVLLGTTFHNLLMFSVGAFRSRMTLEKYWQTATATLLSPASIYDVMVGFIIGACSFQMLLSTCMLLLLVFFSGAPASIILPGIYIMVLLIFLGLGISFIGATIALCFEGLGWIYDYGVQILAFLSCFYYPIEIFPKLLHPLIRAMPTYQMSQLVQQWLLEGAQPGMLLPLGGLTLLSLLVLALPALFFNFSLKRYGIVGY